MQWTVYWDRPTNLINDYLESINGFIQYAFPNWGSSNRGVHAKGESGTASLRASHMGLLDTEGRWLIPTDTSSGFATGSGRTTGNDDSDNFGGGWVEKAISVKTIEEAYYMFTGLQYNTSPIRATETQFAIAGITTPVHSHLILSVLEEPFCYMSEPLVIEPEKQVDWNVRFTLVNTTVQGEALRILGLIVGQHHELINLTLSSNQLN